MIVTRRARVCVGDAPRTHSRRQTEGVGGGSATRDGRESERWRYRRGGGLNRKEIKETHHQRTRKAHRLLACYHRHIFMDAKAGSRTSTTLHAPNARQRGRKWKKKERRPKGPGSCGRRGDSPPLFLVHSTGLTSCRLATRSPLPIMRQCRRTRRGHANAGRSLHTPVGEGVSKGEVGRRVKGEHQMKATRDACGAHRENGGEGRRRRGVRGGGQDEDE